MAVRSCTATRPRLLATASTARNPLLSRHARVQHSSASDDTCPCVGQHMPMLILSSFPQMRSWPRKFLRPPSRTPMLRNPHVKCWAVRHLSRIEDQPLWRAIARSTNVGSNILRNNIAISEITSPRKVCQHQLHGRFTEFLAPSDAAGRPFFRRPHCQQNILWFQISVDDSMIVHEGEALQRLRDQIEHDVVG